MSPIPAPVNVMVGKGLYVPPTVTIPACITGGFEFAHQLSELVDAQTFAVSISNGGSKEEAAKTFMVSRNASGRTDCGLRTEGDLIYPHSSRSPILYQTMYYWPGLLWTPECCVTDCAGRPGEGPAQLGGVPRCAAGNGIVSIADGQGSGAACPGGLTRLVNAKHCVSGTFLPHASRGPLLSG